MRHNKNIIGVCDVLHWIEDKVSAPIEVFVYLILQSYGIQ